MQSHRAAQSLFTTLALGLSLAACAVDLETDPTQGEDVEDLADLDEESFGTTEQYVVSGWTLTTSDEYPPVTCTEGSLVSAVHITGRYGDNLTLHCKPMGLTPADSYWTQYFSEEYRSTVQCGPEHWVTGISCRGAYCDNVSLQCTRFPGTYPIGVRGTEYVSEEQSGITFWPNEYPMGAQCRGKYCDEMRFVVAQVRTR